MCQMLKNHNKTRQTMNVLTAALQFSFHFFVDFEPIIDEHVVPFIVVSAFRLRSFLAMLLLYVPGSSKVG